MKKILAILLIELAVLNVCAQERYVLPPQPATESNPALKYDTLPQFYFGLGTGLNNYVGLIGVGTDIRVYKPLFLRVGVGISSWGAKFSVALRYELKPTNGWAFGLGYSRCFGIKNFQDQLQVDSGSATATKLVTLDLNPASTINLTAGHNWIFHRRHKFYLDFGYAIPIQSNPYVVKNGDVLSTVSKEVMNIISPGGIIVALGIMFGT